MPPRSHFVLFAHGGPEPKDSGNYLPELLRRLNLDVGRGTRLAALWNQPELSDRELLAAAMGRWGRPAFDPARFIVRVLTFSDQDGTPGRVLVAREKEDAPAARPGRRWWQVWKR